MYFPLDQEVDGFSNSITNQQLACHTNGQSTRSLSDSIYGQSPYSIPKFTNKDITGPGWAESDIQNTKPTKKKKAPIDAGRNFYKFLPKGMTKEGMDFEKHIFEKTNCNPTNKYLIKVIEFLETQNIPNFPELKRAHKRSKAALCSTYYPFEGYIIDYLNKQKGTFN